MPLRVAAMFQLMSLVEQIQHAYGAVGFDQDQPPALDFVGKPASLLGELLLVGNQNHFVALGFHELIDVGVRAGDCGPLNVAQLFLFGG